jgi:processive 1,2-diacylglycerol beta-glucosyltransferase
MKNILIISSNYTGHGHKSITESLLEQFNKYQDVKVHVVDGFTLGGNVGLRVGKLYGSVTRNAKELWKLAWDVSMKKPQLICEFVESSIRENLLKLLRDIKPDLILSVHPNFNGSVLNILEEYNIKVPFLVLIADLVSITPLWSDQRADYIICPTSESKYKCLEFGASESRLKVLGFPIRGKFCETVSDLSRPDKYDTTKPLQCLIMSGGEGVGNMSRIAKILLKNFNCHVKIIAGRNKLLKKRLENTLLEQYPDRIEIFGFMENIQDLMLSSDIAFTRGSPNVALEAVMCNVPLVITGALPGQEEGNPGYIQKYNLGVVCKELKNLKATLGGLLADNAFKLNNIKESQREYRDPDSAKNIVDFIMGIQTNCDAVFPEKRSKSKNMIKIKTFKLKKNHKNKII